MAAEGCVGMAARTKAAKAGAGARDDERAALRIENARLKAENTALRRRQSANASILRAIAAAPGAGEATLQKIAETAQRLFRSQVTIIALADGGTFREAGVAGPMAVEFVTHLDSLPIDTNTAVGRAVTGKRTVLVEDARRLPYDIASVVRGNRRVPARTVAAAPMLSGASAIGVVAVSRPGTGTFDKADLAVLEGFADQAVIAIENARLLENLNTSNRGLTELLEHQTATSDILRAIATSPGEIGPVLRNIAETAYRLFRSTNTSIVQVNGDHFGVAVAAGNMADAIEKRLHGLPIDSGTVAGRAVLDRKVVQIEDLKHVTDQFPSAPQEAALVGTTVSAPLLREGVAIGALTVQTNEVRPLNDQELKLLESFADQAVIAIENARLLAELRDSLDRQTATADILRVIASTPGDPTRALDTIAETAAKLFGAESVSILRVDGGMLRPVSRKGFSGTAVNSVLPELPLDPAYRAALSVLEKRQIHGNNVISHATNLARQSGREIPTASVAFTPLLRQGEAIGTMVVNGRDLRPYTESELEVMRDFADQAVIAIENARLLTELRESLDRQTATSEVLEVISSSPGDPQPVFEAMLDRAMRICEAQCGVIHSMDEEGMHLMAEAGVPPAFAEYRRTHPHAGGGAAGLMLKMRKTYHMHDARESEGYRNRNPDSVAGVELTGARTVLYVPMLKDDKVVGVINLSRTEVRPFSAKQIALTENFAAQAVIAIENARLLAELREF